MALPILNKRKEIKCSETFTHVWRLTHTHTRTHSLALCLGLPFHLFVCPEYISMSVDTYLRSGNSTKYYCSVYFYHYLFNSSCLNC